VSGAWFGAGIVAGVILLVGVLIGHRIGRAGKTADQIIAAAAVARMRRGTASPADYEWATGHLPGMPCVNAQCPIHYPPTESRHDG